VKFRELDRFQSGVNAIQRTPLAPVTTCRNDLSMQSSTLAGKHAHTVVAGHSLEAALELLVIGEFTI
jgi:hypothetical protein